MRLTVPYGSETLSFEVESSRVKSVLSPSPAPPVLNPKEEILSSIKAPIGTLGLEGIIRSKRSVAIACDDNTRVTPNHLILLPLLDSLRKLGLKKEDITIFTALGTHRKMTDREVRDKFGPHIAENYRIENHDYETQSSLKFMGKTSGGVPLWVNKAYFNHDVRIGTGGIIPHSNAGWGGGGKTVLPGLGGAETIGKFHCLSAFTTPNALGIMENPSRELIDSFCERVGIHFILNVVLNRDKELVASFAGHHKHAHRAGVQASKRVYGVKASLSEITVSSSYPADLEFWQAHKGLASADLVTKKGGGILLVSPCSEGVSATHKDWVHYLQHTADEIQGIIESGEIQDYIAAGLALSVARQRDRHRVCVVSHGLSHRDAERLRLEKFQVIEEALDHLTKRYGRESKVNVLTHGGETLPIMS